jgi:hypothetical protein
MRDLIEFDPKERTIGRMAHGGNSGSHLPSSPFHQYLQFDLNANSTP